MLTQSHQISRQDSSVVQPRPMASGQARSRREAVRSPEYCGADGPVRCWVYGRGMEEWLGNVATVATPLIAIAALIVSIWASRRVARKREFEILLERIDREAAKREAQFEKAAAERNERFEREVAKREAQFEKAAAERNERFEREAAKREAQFEKAAAERNERFEREAAKREELFEKAAAESNDRFEREAAKREGLFEKAAAESNDRFEREAAKREGLFEKAAAESNDRFEREAERREAAIRMLMDRSDSRFDALLARSDKLFRQSADVTERVARSEGILDTVQAGRRQAPAKSTAANGESEAIAAQGVAGGRPPK